MMELSRNEGQILKKNSQFLGWIRTGSSYLKEGMLYQKMTNKNTLPF